MESEDPLFESWLKPWRWNGSNWFVAVGTGIALNLAALRVLWLFYTGIAD